MDRPVRRRSEWYLSQEAFDRLLEWLNPDRELAGRKYEEIRIRLIKIFTRRGCNEAEELTDETIDRVSRKLAEILNDYVGDPALYFYGVATRVHKEYLKKRPGPGPVLQRDPTEEVERNHHCLDRCMEGLDPASRELVLKYYQDQKRAKIDHRKKLADQMGVTVQTLRMRVHRIRISLQQCVLGCLSQDESSLTH